ncbi:hypothetical protein SAMN00768000_0205 [Sulfobacillus thermosulfidooxidans DSM 9293]|uniref:Uncharacterized protein n=1 Tax=Sulfobacillus thermosulfidooxidans (strain DSM 9293 / VKM B-1269 / AT-1) TaxID=929705 RepID=A0A1W1W8B4_SULTA|nr:hypothetical protein [Sulfobacillus thermosulfidooxidans]SMC01993.1 hypothetical protein SAMN00768000_0205 [Sulfobacillus thermosulfidooxidans DSM 9293]
MVILARIPEGRIFFTWHSVIAGQKRTECGLAIPHDSLTITEPNLDAFHPHPFDNICDACPTLTPLVQEGTLHPES